MMKRVAASLIVIATLALTAGVAAAQASPDAYPTPPPPPPRATSCPDLGVSGSVPPGGTGTVTVTCDAILAGDVLGGTFGSINLPNTTATQDGRVVFTFSVPADFDTNRTVVLGLTINGEPAGSESVFVGANGVIGGPAAAPAPRRSAPAPAPAPRGLLVRTGLDSDLPVKAGFALIAIGGLAVLAVRKRQQDTVTAA